MWAVARFAARRGTLVSRICAPTPSARTFAKDAGLLDLSALDFSKYAGVSGKYASALISVAGEQKEIPTVENDLATVSELAAENEAFRTFLNDPTIPKVDKQAVLAEVLTSAKVGDTVKNLLLTLVENDRTKLLSKVKDDFHDIMSDLRGEVKALITTAKPAEEKEKEKLKQAVYKLGLVAEGKTLILDYQVDYNLIGGVIFQVADKYLDRSVLTRVKEVQRILLEPL